MPFDKKYTVELSMMQANDFTMSGYANTSNVINFTLNKISSLPARHNQIKLNSFKNSWRVYRVITH